MAALRPILSSLVERETETESEPTDLVCSGRGAITGGGSASSSSSSSDTVAMAGVSDTALELCVRSQGERGRGLSDIIVT